MKFFRKPCALVLLSAWVPVQAEWSLAPTFNSYAKVNDNQQLEVKNPVVRIANVSELSAPVEFATDTLVLSALPTLRVAQYTGPGNLNSDDIFLNLGGLRNTQASRYSLDFSYDRATTLTTEVQQAARTNKNIYRTSLSVTPAWTWQATEQASLRFTAGVLDVTFERGGEGQYTDYRQFSVGPDLTYSLTRQTQLLSSAQVSRVETPDTGDSTDSLALQGGVIQTFSDTFRGTFVAGWNFSSFTFFALEPVITPELITLVNTEQSATGGGALVNLALAKDFELTTTTLSWTRSFSPSSQGSRQLRDEVQAKSAYALSDRSALSAGLTFSNQYQESLQQSLPGNDAVQQLYAEGAWRYEVSRHLSAEAGYRHLLQMQGAAADTVGYNEVFFGLRYAVDPLRYR